MYGAVRIIRIKGISIYAHWTLLFLVAWVMVATTHFGINWQQLEWSALFILAVLCCITLHELGHALVASRFGIKAKEVILLPIGGTASIEKLPDNPKQELAVSAAGPLVSLMMAGILLLFMQPYAPIWKNMRTLQIIYTYDFLHSLFMANILLALFNLIPAFPMDGGRIIRALLGFRFNYVRATMLANTISQVVAVAFMTIGVIYLNMVLILIGFFIIVSEDTEEYYLRFKSLVKGLKLKDILMFDYNSLQSNSTMKDATNTLMNNHSKYFIVMDGSKPIGTINRMEVIKAISEKRYDEPVGHLMKDNLVYFDGDKEVGTVLEKLASHDERIYPVMEQDRFTGVVSFNHLIEYLLLNKTDTKEYGRIRSLSGLL